MKAKDSDDFKRAMRKEDNFDIILFSDKPKDRKLIKFIWSFKRKRSPLGVLIKYKVRLYAYGGMQEKGVNYFSNFTTVTN